MNNERPKANEDGIIIYQNRYGTVHLRPGEYKNIKEYGELHLVDKKYRWDMDTCSKITLITENRSLCPTFDYRGMWKEDNYKRTEEDKKYDSAVFHYIESNIAAYCELVHLDWVSKVDPHEELDRSNKIAGYQMEAHYNATGELLK